MRRFALAVMCKEPDGSQNTCLSPRRRSRPGTFPSELGILQGRTGKFRFGFLSTESDSVDNRP
jgi:hypothetical protein